MPDPFITPQDLVDYLGRGGTADAGMLIATDAACDLCRDVGERQINRGTTTIRLDGSGTDALVLPNEYMPVNSAGTVLVNGTADTDYVLGNGVLFRGTAGPYPRCAWPEGRQNVTVTLDHGYADDDVPRSVRVVALSIAARLVTQGVAIEESVGAVRIKYGVNATDLTNGERLILEKLAKR